ncbi:MAG: ketoacyl-ACP synthase III [Burkholderiaceae bacterium]|nr:MAG: ketoacyl-ACP synthase III [Burkholderiaceae bacterium]TAM05348.1 MAG: ketoacyl-ACP synthase III [Pusillimonas sp.]
MQNTAEAGRGRTDVRQVKNVKISGLACAVPAAVREVLDLAEQFGVETIQKIIASTGVERRHIAQDECASDLCAAAARRLLSDLNVEPGSIDTLIFVSQTHDYTLPATACVLQERLGLPMTTAAFDVALGCSGYVYGLWLASSLLSSGGSRRALLLVGDTVSKIVAEKDRSVAALFGDGGSATVLDYDEGALPMSFVLGTDGRGANNLIVPGGAFRDRQGTRAVLDEPVVRGPFDLYMNGAEIFAFTLARVPALIAALHAAAATSGNGIDKYVFHQANRFMLQHLAKRMKLPAEKVVLNMQNFGNTSSTSIPLAISTGCTGDDGMASGRYMLAGFGVGYSWAGCVAQLENVLVSPLTVTEGGNQ